MVITNQRSRLLGGALPVPVPTLGAELVVNGGMEGTYVGGVAPGWSKLGTPTVAESADAYAGSAAQRVADSGGSSNNSVRQLITLAASGWNQLIVYGKRGAGTGALRLLYNGVITTDWSAESWVGKTITYFGGSTFLYFLTTGTAPALFDSVSFKVISLPSMFSTRAYTTHATTKAACTIVAGTQAGVVANLDSATAPANFVIASHDGTSARLTKCVAGTYTELVTATVAYSAGAFVEIRRVAASNTYRLYYNGAQVGADQTIADAGIVSNTLHGMFNTYAGNTLTGFTCTPS